MLKLTKRRRFILTSLLLTLGLFLIHQDIYANRYVAIAFLALVSLMLTIWSIGVPLFSRLWLFLWILPVCFTTAVSLFYFLLPSSLAALIPVLVLYLVGMYVLLLSENIFYVTSIRTIQLYRSASAVAFLFSLLTAFFTYDTILSYRLAYYINMPLVVAVSWLLLVHNFWIACIDEGERGKIFIYSGVLSWAIGLIALAISFWPIEVARGSLLLTAGIYIIIGTAQASLKGRLFKSVFKEYVTIGLIVATVIVLSTRWG